VGTAPAGTVTLPAVSGEPTNPKTDNFYVKAVPVREIDTRFFNDRDGNGDWDPATEELLAASRRRGSTPPHHHGGMTPQ